MGVIEKIFKLLKACNFPQDNIKIQTFYFSKQNFRIFNIFWKTFFMYLKKYQIHQNYNYSLKSRNIKNEENF